MKRKSMRSPRRIDFNHKAFDAIPLNDKAPPPADSISWKLWLACQDIAQKALNTDYLQGIKNGNLDPNSYGQYTIQDAVYCYEWHPIYGLICMIPCDQLWPWLATELKSESGSGNLYSFWITENADWGGAYRLDNFVDDWFAEYPEAYDWDSALFVYQSAMTCELNSFRSACGQTLSPMPRRNST